jgi:pimeloyl-ACP methyl ester carboxylesterase
MIDKLLENEKYEEALKLLVRPKTEKEYYQKIVCLFSLNKLNEAKVECELALDMAEKMYSDAYVKRYRPFLPLLTLLQKPKDVDRFIILAKACLTCEAYQLLDQIRCPVFVIGGKKDKVVTGEASEEIAEKLGCEIYMYENLGHAAYEESKDFNLKVYNFLRG